MTPRDFGPPTWAPREHFPLLAQSRHRVAFVFGSERYGMRNEDVYKCHSVISIPTHPDYGSLNLSQAVQLLSYEWRQAPGGFDVQAHARAAAGGRRGHQWPAAGPLAAGLVHLGS